MVSNCHSIKQALLDRLIEQVEVAQVGNVCVVTLPIVTLDSRWVDLFVEQQFGNLLLAHDGGKSVNELILQGAKITDSVSENLSEIANRYGITYRKEVFQVLAEPKDLPDKLNALGACCNLAMVHLLDRPGVPDEQNLHAQFGASLKQWSKKKFSIAENVKVSGEVKQHVFDFMLSAPASKLVGISILNPSSAGPLAAAERYGFKAADIHSTNKYQFRLVAVKAKAETWSGEASRIIQRCAHSVIDLNSGLMPTSEQLSNAIDCVAA